jgi:TatD DNase family protein
VIDSHCHLAGKPFARDLEAVIARARAAGLARCLVILDAEDDEEFAQASRIRALWPGVKFSIGVHPHHAGHFADNPDGAAALTAQRLDATPDACAVGEIGLDYHYDFAPREVQHGVFRAQLRLARERRLPVVIHTREADEDTLRIIDEESRGVLRGVFHCFTGDRHAAESRAAAGFYLSIPGVATFPKSGDLRDAAAAIPERRLLIETDSPYLAPVPHRGKRNEPAFVVKTLELIAELRGVTPGLLGAQLVENFDELFGGTAQPSPPSLPATRPDTI